MVDHDRLERALLAAARERRPVTYGQLLALFGHKVTRVTVGALCRDLGRVMDRLGARGAPDLAVLVVRRSDGLPGEGWFAFARSTLGYAGPSVGPEAERLVRRLQDAAFAWVAAQRVPSAADRPFPYLADAGAGARGARPALSGPSRQRRR